MKKSVELFYDVVSPYSWIGFEVLCRYRSKWNMNLKLKPFFLGGIMKGSDNRPPGMNMSKFVYMGHDLHRLSNHYKIPMKTPSDVPSVMFRKGTLSAMRFVTAVDMIDPNYTEEISRQLWLRIWSKDEDITEKDSFLQAANSAGFSQSLVDIVLDKYTTQEVKNRLKQYTDEALEFGAFGSPTIITKIEGREPEMIFGSDRFHVLADILGESYVGPLNELSKL